MILPQHTPVIIIGAGPSGLMMAAQLLRQGLHPVIIDSKTSPTNQSRALAIQAKSLEIFRQLGLDDQFINEGNVVKEAVFYDGNVEFSRFNITELGKGNTPFPYVLILEQSKTERILLSYLTANACPVYWNIELLDVHQTEDQVYIKIKYKDEEKYITADWLVAADGAGSQVRKSLKIPFSGSTYHHRFYLADLAVPHDFPSESVRISYKKDGFIAIFPIKNNIFRFIGKLPTTLNDKEDLAFEDVEPYLIDSLNYPIDEENCHWFTTYKLHHRIAERFRDRRCFLIGDAAHIHSPVGGQGMNTGLQDAYNLSWKLSGVIKKEFTSKILDSYFKERLPVANRLLKTTDRLFSVLVAQNRFIKNMGRLLWPLVSKFIWKSPIAEKVFPLLSQTGISYRNSPLSVHHSNSKRIQAGDRVPYLPIFDEKLDIETDLHQWCSKTGFTLLILGELGPRNLLTVAKWIKLNYPFNLNLYYLPPSKRNQNIFDQFEIKEKQKKAIIVRPDMYIGYINDIVDIELIDGYLKEVAGNPNS